MSLKSIPILCLALLLSSCSTNPFQVVISNCPAVAVLSNTGNLTRFKGAGRDADDVAFDATITGVQVDCDEGNDVLVELNFAIVARKGPAMSEGAVTIPYFVVLMRDNNLITAKKIYESTLTFRSGSDRAGVQETIVQRFEDVAIPRRYDYEIMIGFQLTPDEVIYNVLR